VGVTCSIAEQAEEPMITYAVERGGHVRVGLEDAPLGAGKSNVQLVEEAAGLIRSAGNEPAGTKEIRRALGHG
jgi:uncharacterized protein (DUF849 family)